MPRTTQLTVSLKSRPGVLAQLAKTLADARVNIVSLSADAVSGRGKIRQARLPEGAARARSRQQRQVGGGHRTQTAGSHGR